MDSGADVFMRAFDAQEDTMNIHSDIKQPKHSLLRQTVGRLVTHVVCCTVGWRGVLLTPDRMGNGRFRL